MMKMPFGLFNALSIYKQLMYGVLHIFIGRIVLAYLDDVIFIRKSNRIPTSIFVQFSIAFAMLA